MPESRVSPPPTQATGRLLIRALAVAVLFFALAGDAVRNLVGIAGFAAIAILLAVACAIPLWRAFTEAGGRITGRAARRGPWPWALAGYVILATASILWSAYPSGSAVTVLGLLLCTLAGLFLAVCLSWGEFLGTLGTAIKTVLALSLAFELFVSLVLRRPLLPLVPPPGVVYGETPPLLAYWSRNELFAGDRIQGIVGNANLLAIVALFGMILCALRLAQRPGMSPAQLAAEPAAWRGAAWLGVATLVFALTRSSTMILALAAVLACAAAVLWLRRAEPGRARGRRSLALAAVIAVGAAVVIALRGPLLALLGKSPDLTGRLEIWSAVADRAAERPVFGWGFSSPWAPWEPLFDSFVVRNGVRQLQAHNAFLDVWMQLGAIGLILFTIVMVSTLWRLWFCAVDRPRVGLPDRLPYSAMSLAPLLIMVVLAVQSLAESRILIESGWVLLVALAVAGKRRPLVDALTPLAEDARPRPGYVPLGPPDSAPAARAPGLSRPAAPPAPSAPSPASRPATPPAAVGRP